MVKNSPRPTMTLTCTKKVDAATGKISIYAQWRVNNTSRLLNAIKGYKTLVVSEHTQQGIAKLGSTSGLELLAQVRCNMIWLNS